MKFSALQIENFGAIGKAEIELSDRGLILIQGLNEDDTSAISNGAGKSTVPDALSWCLYNKTARGVTGDPVVNRTAKKDCRVSVGFWDGDEGYVVRRHRKHSRDKNLLEFALIKSSTGAPRNLTLGTEKLTQELIEKTLGCSYEVFVSSIYLGQEKMPDLPAMTDKPLKVLIEEAAGITVLERAYEIAKKRSTDAAAATDEIAIKEAIAKAKVEATKERIHDAHRDAAEWSAARDAKVVDIKRVVETLDIEIAELEEEKTALDVPALAMERAAIAGKLAAVEAEKTQERRHAKVVEDVTRVEAAKVSAADSARRVKHAEVARLKKDHDDLQHEMKHLLAKVGGPCDTCGKTYAHGDLAGAEAAGAAKIATIIEKYKVVRAELEALNAAYLKAQEDQRTATETAQSALETYRRALTDVTVTSARMSIVSAALAGHEAAIRIQALKIEEVGRRRLEIHSLEHTPNPFAARIAALGSAHIAEEEEVNVLSKAREAAEAKQELAAAAAKVFAPAGVRAEILDTVTPYLNSRTAHYLGTMSDGNITAVWSTLTRTRAGDLKEKFCIEVTDKVGGDSFAELSGGEKRKVRLSCALAMQDLVATRATKPIDLFIGDEIDVALDDAGLERLTMVLEEKARERGTVLVISHNDMKDWIRESVTLVRSGGTATLKEAA